ncbi:hypothetical protein VNI00_010754 [Paramarasmius palmivorus]|uniref:DUF6535 domain-containing protein n=1 Tax=Paramarasmius palmivorus TaxID=297713 RepID=A0AAW0CG81_9AGAR
MINMPGRIPVKRKPTVDESWEAMLKEVSRYDDEMVKKWKEDIDTLLVFAGLSSAVIAAFAVESYRWLSEDPASTVTPEVLIHISKQLTELTASSASELGPFQRTPFVVEPSSVRINCLWFISLILSLTSGLLGLLCKQWLREHRDQPLTGTPGEALALRQLRRDSLSKWRISSFVSMLTILIEAALVLFFVGLLVLLRPLNLFLFVLSAFAVSLALGTYFITMILPTLSIPRSPSLEHWLRTFEHEVTYQHICPFKSPQAWAMYSFSSTLLRPLLATDRVENMFMARGLFLLFKHPARSWSSLDQEVVDELGIELGQGRTGEQSFELKLNVYELQALQWAVRMFGDSPVMALHLENILGKIPPSVVMSVVFGHWHLTMWEETTITDVQQRLHDPRRFHDSKEAYCNYIYDAPPPPIPIPALHTPNGIKLMLAQQHWLALARCANVDALYKSIKQSGPVVQAIMSGRLFFVPFPVFSILWSHSDVSVSRKSLALLLFCKEAWSASDTNDKHTHELLAFLQALTTHLNRDDVCSVLLRYKRGRSFIHFIHKEIILRRLYQHHSERDKVPRQYLMAEWRRATEKTEELGGLGTDHFDVIPEALEIPLWPPLSARRDESFEQTVTRYSLETILDTQDGDSKSEGDESMEVSAMELAEVEHTTVVMTGLGYNQRTNESPRVASCSNQHEQFSGRGADNCV